MHSVAYQQVLVTFFLNFFVYQLYTQRKINLNILNETECLVCAQIITKVCKYSLKRHYRTCHTKLNSIMGCKKCVLAT